MSDITVRNAKPKDKPYRLTDERGLCLEVRPEGGKWWRLRYRFDDKAKMISLGTYPDTGLKEARKRRDEARALLADGTDPGAKRQAEKAQRKAEAANSFESVARAWLSHRSDAWAGETERVIWSSLQRYVLPTLGGKPVAEVQPADVRDTIKAIEAQGVGDTAGRVFQRVRAIFRYAVSRDLVKAALAENDVPEFLRQLGQYDGEPTTRHALELLMLTAVRPVAQYLTERTELVQWWADHLGKLRKGADVIPFKTA